MDALEDFMKEHGLDIYDIVDEWSDSIVELLETGHVIIEHKGKKLLLTATSTPVI